MNRLVIIDGNAILHRAFHALPPLTDPEGNVVNAVYGFTTMMLRIFTDLAPKYIAVTFDRAAPTFRKEMFASYQAHRPKMDDDLIPQVDKVHDVVKAMGLPVFEMDGFEADDVIGTICKKIEDGRQKTENMIDQVIIVTGDRDILQLVEEGKVFVYMPTKGLSESKLYGEKETLERMGVTPKQIPDFKALAGDASDNYPGVGGIGPKTAVNLLTEFGTVENLYLQGEKGKWGKTGEKVIEKLISGKESALLSHQLATIRRDVPIEIELKEIKAIDTPEVRASLMKFGFKSIITRMDKMKEGKSKSFYAKDPDQTKKKVKVDPEDAGQQSLF
jgi:DNA polymerase-1